MAKTTADKGNSDGYVYLMSGTEYTRDDLVEALDAEAEGLPPETWRFGVWNVDDYIIEALQVGIIEQIQPEDDFDDPWWEHSATAR